MQSMFNLIYKGKGKMPGYGVECAPKVRIGCIRNLDTSHVQSKHTQSVILVVREKGCENVMYHLSSVYGIWFLLCT